VINLTSRLYAGVVTFAYNEEIRMAGFEAVEMDRRAFFRGAGLVGAAVAASVLVGESPAQAQDVEADPLPFPEPKNLDEAQINKATAEARKAAEEAEKLRLENEAAQQTQPADPLDQRKKQAEVVKLEKEAEGDPWWKNLVPDGTFLATAAGGALALWKYLRDKKDTADKDREERLEKERAAEDARFDEISTRLLAAENPTEWKGGDISLLAFVTDGHERFRERVLATTSALLRARPREVGTPSGPKPPYQNLFTAFMTVVEPLRGAAVRERELYQRTVWAGGMNIPMPAVEWEPVADARGLNLEDLYLAGQNLSLLRLDRSSFRGAILSGSVISGSNLDYAHLSAAQLRGVHISNTSCTNTSVLGSDLRGARLIELDYTSFDISAATTLEGALIDGTKGLSAVQIERLRSRGANIVERYNYGPLTTGPGDSETAAGDD
jgi:hypothetical protein